MTEKVPANVRGAAGPIPSVTTGVPEHAQVVRVELPIDRLDCVECAKRVQQALARSPGVRSVFVNPSSKIASIVYDRQQIGLPEMAGVVRHAGYAIGSAVERIGIKGMT